MRNDRLVLGMVAWILVLGAVELARAENAELARLQQVARAAEPEDRALAYTILVILAALVLFLVIGLVAGSFMAGPVM